jgi:hypothetical protein
VAGKKSVNRIEVVEEYQKMKDNPARLTIAFFLSQRGFFLVDQPVVAMGFD